MSKARAEYLNYKGTFGYGDHVNNYVSELETFLKNSEESEKEMCQLNIECKHRIEQLEAVKAELIEELKEASKRYFDDFDFSVRVSEIVKKHEVSK